VQPPTGCLATKRDVQAEPPVNPCVVCKAAVDACVRKCGEGEECDLTCKCNLKGSNPLCAECGSVHCGIDGNDAALQDNLKSDETTTPLEPSTASVRDIAALWPPVENISCDRDIAACKKNCANPHACDNTYNCYHKRHNKKCRAWGGAIPCDCGHTCPRFEPIERRFATPEDNHPLTEQDLSTAPEIAPAMPPPLGLCGLCQASINACKNKCTVLGTCDDTCNCYAQLHNLNCNKNCKLPKCDCGHCCPRLEPLQRRLDTDVAVPDRPKADSTPTVQDYPIASEIAVAMPIPMSNQCASCIWSINACSKKCANPGACDDVCNCYAQLHNRNCWNPKNCGLRKCNCGHTCPRLQPLQRRLANGAVPDLTDAPDALSTDKAVDVPSVDDDSEVQFGITPAMPFTPGTTCLKAISKCKAACANPPACDNTCNCYYKGSRDCKSVKLPECKCGHTCPNPPWH
jgi:hypothetical protein